MNQKFTFKFLVFLVALTVNSVFAQTNPTPQSIPYTQDFSSFTGSTTTYTAGWQGWDITGSLGTSFSTLAPTANRALTAGTNATNSGVIMDMNGKMGIMSTGTGMRTACLALNTTSLSNIEVSYLVSTQRVDGVRVSALGLQYRVGNVGSFTNVAGSEYQNTTTGLAANTTGTAGLDPATKTVMLPSDCNNQAEVQIRWIIRDVSGTGNRPSFSIDDISVIVGSPSPEINIISGATNYLNNSTYNFGTVVTSTTLVTTFAVQNLGLATLNLTTASFTGASEYTINGAPIPATVAAGDVLTFSVEFTPTSAGTHTGVLSISSDDADENPYLFNVTGVGNVPAPEINIIGGATNYLNNSTYDFGTVVTSTTVVTTFAVQNLGIATLNLTTASFTGSSMYIVNGAPIPATIAPGDVLTFSFEYTPTAAGTHTGVLSISSDDADENPYLFNISAVAQNPAAPEIDVAVSTLNFGSILENTTADLTYVVQNTGTADLVLSTSTAVPYSITGTAPTTITAGNSATYTVRFAPTAAGTYNVNLAITSNDADEATVNIALTGIATAVVPGEFFQNFNGLGTTAAATLPIDWKYSPAGTVAPTWLATGNFTNTNQQASSGVPTTGGRYNWGQNATDRALGIMTSGGYTSPNSIMAKFTNNTGGLVDKVEIAYDLERYRVNTAQASVQFYFSTDGTSWTSVSAGDITTTSLPTGASAYSYSPPNLVVNISTYSVTGLSIANNADFYLRWNLNTTGTSSQGIAIDNVWVKASLATPAPEINLTVNSVNQANNTSFDFGTVAVGGTYTATFAIENTGTVDLNISSGVTSNSTEFSINGGTPPFIIAAGNMLTFTMEFNPTVTGTYSNILMLVSDDADESTYTVTFNGISVTPQPEINLMQAATNYLTGSTYAFPNTTVATSTTVVFTMQNTGTADLTVSNIAASGVEFSSSLPSSFTITAGNTLTFSTTFTSTSVGTYNGNISFTNNDADEGTYVLNFTGVIQNAPEPEINVVSTSLNFGSIEENTTADLTYVVQNTGNADLVLSTSTTAPYSIIGTTPTTITAGSSATYTVRFAPTTIGTYNANVTISSNDADESSLTISLTGVATIAMPAIFTETFGTPSGTTAIASYSGWSNSTLIFVGTSDVRTTTGSTGYTGASGSGNIFLTTSGTRNIEISNINTSSCTGLSLSFGVYKSVSGANGSELLVEVSSDGTNYTALTFPALPAGTGWNYVNASGTIPQAANLRIRFTNTSTTVQFRIDDVTLKGSCAPAPEINIVQSATTYLSGSTYNFGTAAVSSSNVVIFTIQNTGNADLTISNSTDGGAAEFTTTSTFPIPLTIAAGNTATFSVTFAPTAVGTYNGSITFDNNDSNEPAYVLNYTGVASTTAPEINVTDLTNSILSGSTYNFGTVAISSTNVVTFRVQNTGTSDLIFSSILFGGAQYTSTLPTSLPTTISAGSFYQFTSTFQATIVGTHTGFITLNNSDSDESAYTINFTGIVASTLTPEINVKQATTSIASGGSHDFGSVTTGTKDVVFTIENTGTAALTISSNTITGAQYSLVGAMPTSVAAGSTADFTVQFSSTTPGAYVGSITIVNNDANEASYVVNFTASVPTSIEEDKADEVISIYPNPNKGNILHFTKATDATIYNAIGAKVMEVKNADKVDVSVLENGIYMVNINNKTKRLIIAK